MVKVKDKVLASSVGILFLSALASSFVSITPIKLGLMLVDIICIGVFVWFFLQDEAKEEIKKDVSC